MQAGSRLSSGLIDIAINLTDPMFSGVYNHGAKRYHQDDFEMVLARAKAWGVSQMIITGGCLSESKDAAAMAKKHGLFCTVGCHPTRCSEFEDVFGKRAEEKPQEQAAGATEGTATDGTTACERPVLSEQERKAAAEQYYDALRQVIIDNKEVVAAVGECGLDYDRTHFCPIEVQQRYFDYQFALAEEFKLPMFLHNRNTNGDFVKAVVAAGKRAGSVEGGSQQSCVIPYGGVVHSFTGSLDEMKELIELGFYIGVNGCSLKTDENLSVAAAIPLERLLLETDAPWCDIRPAHASHKHVKTAFSSVKKDKLDATLATEMRKAGLSGTDAAATVAMTTGFVSHTLVKGRNEPCTMIQVAEIVAGIRSDVASADELAAVVLKNTMKLFPVLAQ